MRKAIIKTNDDPYFFGDSCFIEPKRNDLETWRNAKPN